HGHLPCISFPVRRRQPTSARFPYTTLFRSGARGDGTRPVNLVLALVGTLGLNLLALLFWLMSFLIGDSAGGSWLGESWLWLTRKLARGPDAALVPRALVGLLARNRSLRWLLGAVSHGWW